MTGDNQRDKRRGARLTQWLAAFARQTRGNVAMMFALALPLLLMVGLGAVDIHQASRVKANLQDALDAAALVAGRSSHTDKDKIQKVGMDALKANMPDYYKGNPGDTASFVLKDNVLKAEAKVNVKVLIANIVLPPYGRLLDDYLPVSASSEVLRASRNVEVGLALDITESMKGQQLIDLQNAARELVDIVVQEPQGAFYSVMGIVPYSASVNLGTQLSFEARGNIRGATDIISGAYLESGSIAIESISSAEEGVITTKQNHNLGNGRRIRIESAKGYTSLNNNLYYVSDVKDKTFKLKNSQGAYVNTSKMTTYTGGGVVKVCIHSSCGLVITSSDHKLKDNEKVLIQSMRGVTSYNGKVSIIKYINKDSFLIDGSSYSSTVPTQNYGNVQCLSTGCAKFEFSSRNGTSRLDISECVTERIGTNAYTDAAPSDGSYFGLMYPGTSGRSVCPEAEVLALTSQRSALKNRIGALEVEGVTAGQIGLAWAWNLVSPNFNEFWGQGLVPGVRDDAKTLKVVVLMTDGEFNTNFCDGVVASNAPGRSLVGNDKAVMQSCAAPNGDPLQQAKNLCQAMKSQGVIVYTVGFKVDEAPAIAMLRECATTTTNHYHHASTGGQLQDAFRAIGRDITRLRLAR